MIMVDKVSSKLIFQLIMIDGRNFFDQPLKNDLRTYGTLERLRQVKVMMFIRLSLFQNILQINCNRFK